MFFNQFGSVYCHIVQIRRCTIVLASRLCTKLAYMLNLFRRLLILARDLNFSEPLAVYFQSTKTGANIKLDLSSYDACRAANIFILINFQTRCAARLALFVCACCSALLFRAFDFNAKFVQRAFRRAILQFYILSFSLSSTLCERFCALWRRRRSDRKTGAC